MTDINQTTSTNPNPQGKGCIPVLQDWNALRPQLPERKSGAEILRDYCLSALVLAARFQFRPVPGKAYYLYVNGRDWNLSLIAPQEWGARQPGAFVAECCLQTDMTWQLQFTHLQPGSEAANQVSSFVDAFSTTLAAADSVLDDLPFYVAHLPYYQRMLATGLSVSLQHSIGTTGTQALKHALPALLPLTRQP